MTSTLLEEARGFAGVVPLVKAHLVGRDAVAPSNVDPEVDQPHLRFAEHGAIAPPFDPEILGLLIQHSNSLRQNIDAYATNIDAFGHRFEPIIDLEAEDASQRLADAIYIERLKRQEDGTLPEGVSVQPTADEVSTERTKIAELMRMELSRVRNFFDFCCVDMSFVRLRRMMRQDLEALGNAYTEVLRNAVGELAQFVYVPAFTVRLMPLDREPVDIEVTIRISDIHFDTIKTTKQFRRFVQIIENRVVFFKEFGDPRIVSRKTGRVFQSLDKLRGADREDGPATELIHFKVHDPMSAYGTPRWIGTLLAVMGSRQSEEVNFLYFQNKTVPPLVMTVDGGRLSEESVPRIEKFIDENIKGKHNFHKILILEAEPAEGTKDAVNTGRLRIKLFPLTGAQQSDALFQKYDQNNIDKVGQAFRLPRMLRGDVRDFNRSTALAALMFAEQQVFQPEREDFDFLMNRRILIDMGIRFWRFRSNAPLTRDPSVMADIVRGAVNAGVLVPAEGRELLGDVFNRDFRKIDADWVKQPIQLTIAGLPVQETAKQDDLTTADLATRGGLLQPAQGAPLGEPESVFSNPPRGERPHRTREEREQWEHEREVLDQVRRLLRIRNELSKAEQREADQNIAEPGGGDEVVVKVPAAEMKSWLADDAGSS